jgi:hypothetical protein
LYPPWHWLPCIHLFQFTSSLISSLATLEIPLYSIPSGFIFFLSFWLQTLDCPTLYLEEWKWSSTTRSQARATEDYIGLIGVTLKKSMFRQTSWERCLTQECRSFRIWPMLKRFPFSIVKR